MGAWQDHPAALARAPGHGTARSSWVHQKALFIRQHHFTPRGPLCVAGAATVLICYPWITEK